MIIINYGEDKDLKCVINFSKANEFAKKYCQGKSIIDVLSTKLGEFDGEFLLNMVHHFQVGEKKLSKEEISKIFDEIFSDNEEGQAKLDLPTLFIEFVKEFDYGGVFKKGMGFSLAKQMETQFEKMINNKVLEEQ